MLWKHSSSLLILMKKVELLQLIVQPALNGSNNSLKVPKTAFQPLFDSPVP